MIVLRSGSLEATIVESKNEKRPEVHERLQQAIENRKLGVIFTFGEMDFDSCEHYESVLRKQKTIWEKEINFIMVSTW
jgi:hypothetical protein